MRQKSPTLQIIIIFSLLPQLDMYLSEMAMKSMESERKERPVLRNLFPNDKEKQLNASSDMIEEHCGFNRGYGASTAMGKKNLASLRTKEKCI
jgi:hypothetical protein